MEKAGWRGRQRGQSEAAPAREAEAWGIHQRPGGGKGRDLPSATVAAPQRVDPTPPEPSHPVCGTGQSSPRKQAAQAMEAQLL